MSSLSSWPVYTEEEADAVRDVLLSNGVNQWTGPAVSEFETAFSEAFDVSYSLAFSNGTTALDAALRAVGIMPGDEVIVSPRTFIASASSVILAGGVPVFADVNPESQLITPDSVRPLITERTKAILCVHLAGWPCDMDGFRALTEGRNIALIEDCAQAHGAMYKGHAVGSLGDIAAWSFCQDKILTTGGEGGMVTTDCEALFRAAWAYRDHGKSYSAVYERNHPPGFRWLHETFGTNARMTSMQAVIGSIQLGRLVHWHLQRTRNAERIRTTARACPSLRVPEIPDSIEHAWYRCDVFVRPERLCVGWSRDRIIQTIVEQGVPCLAGPCPELYRERAFEDAGIGPAERLPHARTLGETSLMFLVHPTLTENDLQQICDVLTQVLAEASGGDI